MADHGDGVGPGAPAPRRSSFTSSVAAGTSSFVVVAAIALLASVLTARLYGVRVVGEFALISILTSAVWILSTVQEQPALIKRLVPLEPKDHGIVGYSLPVYCFSTLLTVVVGAVVLAVGYVLYRGPLDHPALFGPAAVLIANYVVVMNLGWNMDTVFIAMRASRALFWIRVGQGLAFLVLAVLAHVVTDSYWGLVAATAGSWLVSVIQRCWLIRPYVTFRVPRQEIREGFRSLPEILRFGVRAAPGALADGISDESGTWMIGILGTVGGVGAFSRAWTSSRQFFQLVRRISEMLLPTLVERNQSDRPGFERALVDSMRLFAIAALGVAAVTGGAAIGLMGIYGPGFSGAANALALLILVPAFFGLATMQYQALFAAGLPLATSVASGVRLIVTIAVGVPLTQRYGITGAALAMAAGSVAQLAYVSQVTRRGCDVRFLRNWPPRQVVGLVVAYGVAFAVGRAVYLAFGGLGGTVASLGAGLLAYVVALIGGGLHERDRLRLSKLASKLRRRGLRSTAA